MKKIILMFTVLVLAACTAEEACTMQGFDSGVSRFESGDGFNEVESDPDFDQWVDMLDNDLVWTSQPGVDGVVVVRINEAQQPVLESHPGGQSGTISDGWDITEISFCMNDDNNGGDSVPEFTLIGAGIAGSAALAYTLIRRRK